jgi:hypothetical protein
MARRKRVAIGHVGADWYTYTTPETLQKLQVMTGAAALPADLMPLVIRAPGQTHNAGAIRPGFYSGTDVFVIEISSVKRLQLRGWHLQQWCVKLALEGKLDDASAELAKTAVASNQSRDEVKRDLVAIAEALGKPVVFVPHLTIPRDDGTPFPERRMLREVIAEVCDATPSATLWDPTPLVLGAGVRTAMLDASHYTKEFDREIGEALVECVERVCRGKIELSVELSSGAIDTARPADYVIDTERTYH